MGEHDALFKRVFGEPARAAAEVQVCAQADEGGSPSPPSPCTSGRRPRVSGAPQRFHRKTRRQEGRREAGGSCAIAADGHTGAVDRPHPSVFPERSRVHLGVFQITPSGSPLAQGPECEPKHGLSPFSSWRQPAALASDPSAATKTSRGTSTRAATVAEAEAGQPRARARAIRRRRGCLARSPRWFRLIARVVMATRPPPLHLRRY